MIGGMNVEAMPDRDWKRAFDEPIPLPDGGELRTLDAGRYVDALPRSMHEREEKAARREGDGPRELINAAFLKAGGKAEQFRDGFQRAVDKGLMVRHESGTYAKFTPSPTSVFF
jgi:hypothetical protein